MMRLPGRVPKRVWLSAAVIAILVGTLLGAMLIRGSDADTGSPRLSFEERSHDFGQIRYDAELEYRFVFTNTGGRPLQMDSVTVHPVDPGG